MKNIKCLPILFSFITIVSCNDPEDVLKGTNIEPKEIIELPQLTTGTANLSNYVSIGNSLTAGFSDGALFKASQENSFPNILAQKFSILGGGEFVQPLTNDNFGGLLLAGNRIQEPRLVTTGGAPLSLESVIGPISITTDIASNNPIGPFNNMGVPGAKSFHLLAPGYGNITNLPYAANPYFVRMTGNTPNATILELTMEQMPTFFSLWIGNNDILGYATTGGDDSDPITSLDGTPGVGFRQTYAAIIATLTAGNAQGVIANIPYITDIPHFTTVPYNALDPNDDETGATFLAQVPTLNGIFGQLNQVYSFLETQGIPNASDRSIVFSETEASALLIKDETLTNLSAQITNVLNASPTFPAFVASFGLPEEASESVANLFGLIYGQARQATSQDLFVLPSLSIISTINENQSTFLQSQDLPEALANQFSTEGITLPLEDKWVLLPSEQENIQTAIDNFNEIIETAALDAKLAFVDANALLQQLTTTGIQSNDINATSNLITGGAFSLDGIHLTSRGYALMANEFMKAIDVTYGSNFEASGNLVNIGNFPTNYSPLLP